jgi:hypothetical protein
MKYGKLPGIGLRGNHGCDAERRSVRARDEFEQSGYTFANGSSITFNAVDVFDSTAGSAPGTWNSNYQTLTNVADYNGTNNMSITLGGLTAGHSYLGSNLRTLVE